MNAGKFNLFVVITGYISLVVSSVIVLASKVKTNNLNDLKERVALLEKEREDSRTQHIDNQKAIANLEGQLNTYKEIPLKEISSSLVKLATSNDQILNTLKNSALIASHAVDEGGMLVKTQAANPLSVEVKESA